MPTLARRVVAEGVGTAFLLAAVVGSGIMAERLSGGNEALTLLCNTIPTGAILVVLVLIFGPISGAHLNPIITTASALRSDISVRAAALYIAAQISGGIIGVYVTHAMFDLPILQLSLTARSGTGQWLAEGVASFGLSITVLACVSRNLNATPYAVGLYITAAYWFTASTSFANPAVTIARSLSDSYSGIALANVPAFIGAQFAGMFSALMFGRWLWTETTATTARPPKNL